MITATCSVARDGILRKVTAVLFMWKWQSIQIFDKMKRSHHGTSCLQAVAPEVAETIGRLAERLSQLT